MMIDGFLTNKHRGTLVVTFIHIAKQKLHVIIVLVEVLMLSIFNRGLTLCLKVVFEVFLKGGTIVYLPRFRIMKPLTLPLILPKANFKERWLFGTTPPLG